MIPQATPPAGYHFRDVQLEMSLKPFWDNSPETCEAVCRELFLQWLPVCRFAQSVSVMLWIGDGSEILEHDGDTDRAFEWGRYQGAANPISWHGTPGAKDSGKPDHDAIGAESKLRDPEQRGVHMRSYLYRPEPATFTYRWLRMLTDTIKRVGEQVTGVKNIYVGATFDIGPEFAISRFKYDWHPEICGGGSLFGGKFIRCDAPLKADTRKYAGFPDGIPEGTSVGIFLGRQCRHFFADCGYDFLWLSNGFGFALEPWALTGAIFNGREFDASAGVQTARGILEFWQDLTAELPGVPIRTRGTNLATGIDLGSDASPLREIYANVPQVEPPVNSPWAALDGDIGLELAGWMSHMVRHTGKGYRFRFYIHDPWWLNSPWLDRYQRQPFDIFLPLAVSRLTEDGGVEAPCDLSLLTVDDSYGQMPPTVPMEVLGHLMHAREFLPDAPGPLLWVYPFDEYHDLITGADPDPALPFFGDWFIRGAISRGIPINTVADWRSVAALLAADATHFNGQILLVPALPQLEAPLLRAAEAGARVVFYGPLDKCAALRERLGLGLDMPLAGDFTLAGEERVLRHLDFISGGGWSEVPGEFTQLAGDQKGMRRAINAWRDLPGGGCLSWIRGSLATAEYDPAAPAPIKGPRLLAMDAPAERARHESSAAAPEGFFAGEDFVRGNLSHLGLVIDYTMGSRPPHTAIHRHRNAFVFSGHHPNGASPLRLALSLGAPQFPSQSCLVEGGATVYSGPPAWHHVTRAFVQQEEASTVTCRTLPPIQYGYTARQLLTGLHNATVRFFPEPGSLEKLEVLTQPLFPYFVGNFLKPEVVESREHGPHVVLRGVSGELLFSW